MATAALTLPEHEKHHHRHYGLTCEQYEGLLAACGRCCETCGLPGSAMTRRKLFIDHDGSIGQWAVRGMLCITCNANLRHDKPVPEWATAYLANPWYRRMLRELDISELLPEPTTGGISPDGGMIGPRVADFDGHIWRPSPRGWTHGHKKCTPIPWTQLVHRFGPHNLTPWLPQGYTPLAEAAMAVPC